MFTEKYENLSDRDKVNFKKACNTLLSETFVLRNDYKNGSAQSRNQDYEFLSRYEDIVREYLSLSGWSLNKDDRNGYFYIENDEGINRRKFSLQQTQILLALRFIYDEHLKEAGLFMAVTTNVGELLHQLVNVLGFFDKKPNMTDFKRDMNIFDGFNVIKAINGSYKDTDCDFVILPTIQIAVPADRVAFVANEIRALEGEIDEKTDEDVA